MISKKIQLPREIHIGSGVINEIGNICSSFKKGDNILIVSGKNTFEIAGHSAKDNLESNNFNVEKILIKQANWESINKVKNNLDNISLILGIGGGKVIDVAKMAATGTDIDFISVPTAASHDGIASPRASIKDRNNATSLEAKSPISIIADTEIIAKAPFKLLVAGYGDIISNYSAILDWKLSNRLLNEHYSEYAASLSLMSAKMMIDSADIIKNRLDESARLIVKALISSSTAMIVSGNSRPASGAEHKFSHALDQIAPKSALHGEQCGVGTIMMMCLHGQNWKFIKESLKKVNAPTTAEELNIDEEYIIEALTNAHNIRRERYTILGDRGLTKKAAENLAIKTGVIT